MICEQKQRGTFTYIVSKRSHWKDQLREKNSALELRLLLLRRRHCTQLHIVFESGNCVLPAACSQWPAVSLPVSRACVIISFASPLRDAAGPYPSNSHHCTHCTVQLQGSEVPTEQHLEYIGYALVVALWLQLVAVAAYHWPSPEPKDSLLDLCNFSAGSLLIPEIQWTSGLAPAYTVRKVLQISLYVNDETIANL